MNTMAIVMAVMFLLSTVLACDSKKASQADAYSTDGDTESGSDRHNTINDDSMSTEYGHVDTNSAWDNGALDSDTAVDSENVGTVDSDDTVDRDDTADGDTIAVSDDAVIKKVVPHDEIEISENALVTSGDHSSLIFDDEHFLVLTPIDKQNITIGLRFAVDNKDTQTIKIRVGSYAGPETYTFHPGRRVSVKNFQTGQFETIHEILPGTGAVELNGEEIVVSGIGETQKYIYQNLEGGFLRYLDGNEDDYRRHVEVNIEFLYDGLADCVDGLFNLPCSTPSVFLGNVHLDVTQFDDDFPGYSAGLIDRVEGIWTKIELPGTTCGNGSQYKFFVNFSNTTNDVSTIMEPGGACWDFDSCSGNTGIRGARNTNGIPDGHMADSSMGIHTPFTFRYHPWQPVEPGGWNRVFLPYCTADIYSGQITTVYKDPSGVQPDLTWHHAGHANVEKAIEWMQEVFPSIPRFFATGCSAGGTGTLANYFFFRRALNIEKGYMLNDSGPIYPTDGGGNSLPMHEKIREAWALDDVIVPLQSEFPALDPNQFGTIVDALADKYPDDRMAITQFTRDYNYSLYSYESFYGLDESNPDDKETTHELWKEDEIRMMAQYDQYSNFGYYLPYYRAFNASHCTTLLDFSGTEIGDTDLGMYVDHLLDDSAPLESFYEEEQPDELNQPEWYWDILTSVLVN